MSSSDSSSSSDDVVVVRMGPHGTEVMSVLVSPPRIADPVHASDVPEDDAGTSQPLNGEAGRRSENVGSGARGKGVASFTLDRVSPIRLTHFVRPAAQTGETAGPSGVPPVRSPRVTGTVSRKRSRDESAPVIRMVGESSTRPQVSSGRIREAMEGGVPSWTRQLMRENVFLRRDMASLKMENDLLRARSGPAELVRLRRYAEERDAKVRELEGLVGQEVDLRSLAELKYEDLKAHLNALEHANSELVGHVKDQMTRLRTSRREYGIECARLAAERTHARLAGLAQTSLTRARQYFHEQGNHLSLVSRASLTKTKLDDMDLMASAGVTILPENRARVQASYDELVREIEGQEMMVFYDREYTFAPGPCSLPSSFEVGCPSSPLGAEEFGIKEAWTVENFCPSECEPLEDTVVEVGDDSEAQSDRRSPLRQTDTARPSSATTGTTGRFVN